MKQVSMRALNLALYLGSCLLLGTGLLLKYRLPPGSRGGRGMEALGLDRHQWGDVHFWIALAVAALVIIHLVQNWAWLRRIAGSGRGWPLAGGLLAGAAVVAVIVLLPVTEREGGRHRRNWDERHEAQSPPQATTSPATHHAFSSKGLRFSDNFHLKTQDRA